MLPARYDDDDDDDDDIYILKLVTFGEGDTKAPFSIATTAMCRGGRFSIP